MSRVQFKQALYMLLSLVTIITVVYQTIGVDPSAPADNMNPVYNTPKMPAYEITAKRDLLALMMAYPEYIKGVEKQGDIICLIMQSGRKIAYDDQRPKNHDTKLAKADIQDMMEQIYPLEEIDSLMQGNFEPGRVRCYDFLKEVYGSTKAEITGNLTNITLGGKTFSFQKNNCAVEALKSVFGEINALTRSNPKIYSFVFPVSGTFAYRYISGTGLLSAHAFGIAIDLKSHKHDYWKWANNKQGQNRLEDYPKELVKVFENHGFIWGGKWAHFDILHFEYRPELIIKSKYFIDPNSIELENHPWYFGFPHTNQTQRFIDIINKAFDSAP